MTVLRELAAAAVAYAEAGLRVLPLQPGSKVPYRHTRGVHDASSDPAQVASWWTVAPASNIGVATGWLFDAVDIDGPPGILSWARAGQPAQVLGIVNTPRPGGSHLWVPVTGCGNRIGMLPGVDYRGRGGYVVAPPSVLAPDQAAYPGRYSWRRAVDLHHLTVPR